MKLLVISANVGSTAPGIVFEKIIQGLSINNEVNVLTASYKKRIDLSNVKQIIVSKKSNFHPYIFKLLVSIFGINPYDLYWSNKSIRKLLKNNIIDVDIVCSFISNHNYMGLICGEKISNKYKIKHVVYSVDAIPAPGWPENKKYFNAVKGMMNKYLKNIDAIFSSNKKMLEYQLTTFKHKAGIITDVVFNPSENLTLTDYPPTYGALNYFLYTGNIYGVRNPKYLLSAFEMFLDEFPNSKLVFVGTKFNDSSFYFLKETTIEKIEIHPFTSELNEYYRKATALIDIDADIDNDVFLSSKMINYLSVKKVIISETGNNSPSRELFSGCESIIQCGHDANQIYNAFIKASQLTNNLSFESRKKILEKFSINNATNVFEESLRKLYIND